MLMKRLTALIIGVSLIIAASAAFGGPVERFFYEKNYVRSVYDVFVTHEIEVDGVTQTVLTYGQALAIGPHYLLTAAHVIAPEDSITIFYTQPADDTIASIKIIAHSFITTPGGIHINIYDHFEAEVVEQGRGGYEDDWAILRVKETLADYIVPRLGLNLVSGDDVWNISGNVMPVSFPFPYVIVGTELEVYDAIYEFGELTLFGADPFDVYVATPVAVSGDSGSPVFDRWGNLIGILIASGKKISLISKAEKFKTAFELYKGK